MMTTSHGGADLQALMAIADRYARRLVADAGSPAAVLLIERAGDLEVVVLDDEGWGVVPQVRLLLARSGATSAALLVEVPAPPAGAANTGFWILGEGIDGATARRRYRVRPCGRVRRLTPLADGEDLEVEDLFRPLFPVHLKAGGTGDSVAAAPSAAMPMEVADAAPPAAFTERIVAA
jgi:hypothetical protein